MSDMDGHTCTVCNEHKPLGAFAIRKTHRVGKPVSVCNPCKTEYNRKRRIDNPEHVANIERRSKFKKQYGITLDDYNDMLSKQNGGCGICGSQTAGNRTKYFAVDHCHTTGKVRGLLCTKCNRGLGLFNDNPERLLNAVNYLKEY